jgi:cytochrome P450
LLVRQFDALDRWQRELGPVVEVPLGLSRFVMVNSSEVASEMLVEKVRNFPRGGPAWDGLSMVFGKGLVGAEGERWLTRRRMIQPHFHHEGVRKLCEGMSSAVDEVCARWRTRLAGGAAEVDIEFEIAEITMAVILRVVFGAGLSGEEYARCGKQIAYAVDSIAVGWLSATLPRWLPLPGRARFRQTMGEIDAMVLRLARARRESGVHGDDLLGMLVSLWDAGELDDEGLRDETISLFVAGLETTANTLCFTMWELARRPELLARLRDEADRELPEGQPVDHAMIGRLALADQVFRESLRMYPGGLWIPRIALADDTLGGHPVAAGTTVVVSLYNCHRDPAVWAAPHEFRPERHAHAGSERRAWIPFGLGQHMCVGMRVAMAEGPLVLARLAQRFEFETTKRSPIMRMSTALTTKSGIWLRMQTRAT